LGKFVIEGVSIFEYPWQIAVLGLLMGILGVVPVLISQLMNFAHSVPFILAVLILANLPGFAACLLVSCVAVASRPLRFRSRFISVVLCMAPQLIYWGYFGGAKGVEPLRFGYSFAPWIHAWLTSLGIAGAVLGIGHFTRYRPGLVWITTSVVLIAATVTFDVTIGFDELDYQLYVAKNNPELVEEFHGHSSIMEALDETIKNPTVRKYLAGFFYPGEPIPLRAELKKEIQIQLNHDRWPHWFIVPDELNYQTKKEWLFDRYDLFIRYRPKSRRMPIALYYKALLSEYSPDMAVLDQKEILHFYSDYPFERTRRTWYRLYSQFGDSAESIEARWRIAQHWAGQGRFEEADGLLIEAQQMVSAQLKIFEEQQPQAETLFSPFRPPADSAMTKSKLIELQRRINQLRNLIGEENKTKRDDSEQRLAKFATLNPHGPDYARELEELLEQTGEKDPLRDNILLSQAKLVADDQRRAEKLDALHKEYKNTDSGAHALYELGLLKISLWQQQDDSEPDRKKGLLLDARDTLASFIDLYPDSFCAEQVRKNLESLPAVE
jgi:hypothetical protein